MQPSQKVFDEIKAKAIDIRNTYDDTFGYRSEKIDRIKDIENIMDNAIYIVGMFDGSNYRILKDMLSDDGKEYLNTIIN